MRPATVPLARVVLAAVVAVSLPQRVRYASAEPMSRITFEAQPGAIAIRADGGALATYVYEDAEILRPYFKDVFAPGAIQVTRRHPPTKGIDRTDHADMHPGLFLAFGDLDGADFWRNKARVEHIEFVRPPSSAANRGFFAVRNRYVTESGTVCEELCEYTFALRPAGYVILWDSTFSASRSDVAFGDQEEMGLAVRVATPLAVRSGQGGRILDSEGRRNEKEIWGRRAAWCDYGGHVGDTFVGIAIMPHPDNFRPCWWHVRDYGLMVANPFGRSALASGQPSRAAIDASRPFRLRFGILIHAGDSERGVDFERAYQDYLAVAKDLAETIR
jgi:hypothetical protein